ncbi:MAG TPA: hypothetical protein VH740_06110 [Vicinamibacterales bacterium]|jgi:NADH-quinone oxidoreductase subunit M
MPHHLSILLWIPAAGAIAARLLERRERLSRAAAITSAALAAIVAAPLWFAYQPRGAEWQFADRADVLPSMGASYSLGLDGFGLALILQTVIVGLVLAALRRPGGERTPYGSLLTLEFALLGSFMSLDLLLWLAFAILALASATHLVRTSAPTDGSIAWLWPSTFAACALVVFGVVVLSASFHTLSGAYSFDLRVLRPATIPSSTQAWVLASLSIGFAGAFASFLVRRSLVALSCAAVVLVTAAYAFARIALSVLPDASRAFGPALMTLAIAGSLVAALAMFAQTARTRRAAFAMVCQLGAAIAGAFSLTPDGITGSMVLASVPVVGGLAGGRFVVAGVWPLNRLLAVLLGVSVAVAFLALLIPFARTIRERSRLAALVVFTALAVAVGIALYPSPLVRSVETSVARVVLRVSPEYAAAVADCLSQPPPPPAETGLPPGVVMAAPCADGTKAPADPHKK